MPFLLKKTRPLPAINNTTNVYLKRLKAIQFRNCSETEMLFCPQFNVFTGKNGSGKTNLLDAIHCLCVCKSHFGLPDSVILKQGTDFFRLEGDFQTAETPISIACKYAAGQKKVMECNRTAYKRLSEHIGRFPVVMIAPDDGQWLEESSENRRQLVDFTLSQLDSKYLDSLSLYNQVLKQRNALLKQETQANHLDLDLLGVYDQQLAPLATYIYEQRQQWSAPLQEHLQAYYALISGDKETVEMQYQSDLSEHSAAEWFKIALQRDTFLQRTTRGVHRDDWVLSINGNSPLRRFASQGQRKSYLLALRLAQHELLRLHYQNPPILLLDDVFDKLDSERMMQLLKVLAQSQFGQIFITDTSPNRVTDLLQQLQSLFLVFSIDNGKAEPLTIDN